MEKEQLLGRMMHYCSLSEHCRSDVRTKLEKFVTPFTEEIIDQLCKEGYIDETRYSAAFARDKSALQGWGREKIKLALQRKGISRDIVDEALLKIDSEAADKKLISLLRVKERSLASECDERRKIAKIYRYALSRGYGYDQIKQCYDNLRRDKSD